MRRVLWLLRWRTGEIALAAGLLLLAGAAAFTFFAVRPLEQRLAALERARHAQPQAELARIDEELAHEKSPKVQLAAFYGYFRRGGSITEQLGKLYELAKANGLEMQRAEYRMVSGPQRKLDRYQVVVPMQGSYATIRAFTTAALRDLPTMSVDHVQFQRKAIGEKAVEGQITFSFHLAR